MERLTDAARRLGVDIDSVCGGRGICGRCQVEVSEGEYAKHAITSAADHLSPLGAVERAYAADKGLATGRRLGCTAQVEGELGVLRRAAAMAAAARLVGGGERRLGALTDGLATWIIDEPTWRALDPGADTLRDIDTPDDLV